MTLYYETELYHHGVKGMKWGVRRYQNADGSLTPAGKKHLASYETGRSLDKKVSDEGRRLIKSSSKLVRDFGHDTDDHEFLVRVAQDYNLDTRKLETAMRQRDDFYKNNNNLRSADIGHKIAKHQNKIEKKASIARGKELSRRLTDPSELRWNEDRNNRLIKQMNKKDWRDVRNYEHDKKVKQATVTALTTVGGMAAVTLLNKKHVI